MTNRCEFKDAAEMAAYIQTEGVELVDACFTDPLGTWHHCTFSASECEESNLTKGFPFDGSSIRLFCSIDASDSVMIPDPGTCWIDPFQGRKVVHVTCNVVKVNGETFNRCPRSIALKAQEYLRLTGIADTVYIGSEPEFFIFDSISYCCAPQKIFVEIDQQEAPWNCSKNYDTGNLGHRMPAQRWYFPTPPTDQQYNLRNEMLLTMKDIGIPIEKHHHEVASCQHELGFRCRPLVECADLSMCYKYVVKNTAKKFNKTATFMPKPLYGDSGSGMHCHQSLWKDNINLFFNADPVFEPNAYMNLSQLAMYYIGGMLKHSKAILAFSNPTVNSYKRLVPGFEAPSYLVYSKGNRSAAIRVPLADSTNPKLKRIEFRCPDPSCCPYLAFAAMLMAGIDGIQNKISPGNPCDCDIFKMGQKDTELFTPSSLDETLDALQQDHQFLTKGDVFTEEFIQAYVAYKKTETEMCKFLPHPKEFELYYNC